jgi:hypothetical protein
LVEEFAVGFGRPHLLEELSISMDSTVHVVKKLAQDTGLQNIQLCTAARAAAVELNDGKRASHTDDPGESRCCRCLELFKSPRPCGFPVSTRAGDDRQ